MIGIITLIPRGTTDTYNFGGILQNFALNNYLNNVYKANVRTIYYSGFNFLGCLKTFAGNYLHIEYNNKKIKIISENEKLRIKSFKKFINANIPIVSYFCMNNKSFKAINKNFDNVIVGSDQVWNFGAINKYFQTNVLSFLDPGKRICYAASIVNNAFSKDFADKFAEEINKFKAVSVREERGAEIIKELSGVDAEVLIDPTMLLTREDWLKVAKKHPQRSDKPYILKYFLGNQSDERKSYINSIAKKSGIGIYDLMNKESKVYTSGPAEFIDLIANSEVVFTDSFHACVFSILMGKPFVVMNREQRGTENMSARIVTLLEKLNLEDRLPGKVTEDKIFECNYKKAYENLEIERAKAKDFLEKALND